MKNLFARLLGKRVENKREVEVMYFGRPSELLMMTSERVDIREANPTLGQVLNSLRKRGARWAYELDDSHLICTINGRPAGMTHTVTAGDELGVFSRRSLFER